MLKACRRCTHCKVNRPRGLCWSCYYTPGVKDQYPPISKYGRRGVGNVIGNRPLPAIPTTAAPGTPEKLAVLEARAKALCSLFHPDDARFDGDPRPLDFLGQLACNKPAASVMLKDQTDVNDQTPAWSRSA